MRRAARTDANKKAIVGALRAAGASVYDLKLPVDLLVGINGETALCEIKDGSKPPSARKYTPHQTAFISTWLGGAVFTVSDIDGALRMLRVMQFGGICE